LRSNWKDFPDKELDVSVACQSPDSITDFSITVTAKWSVWCELLATEANTYVPDIHIINIIHIINLSFVRTCKIGGVLPPFNVRLYSDRALKKTLQLL
jgi:hypothetical protein